MFTDRVHAGEVLGRAMVGRGYGDAVVLGLPRGGVIVAAGVARALQAPLDVVVVRKLGAPGNPELGIGAVAESGVTVLNEDLIRRLGVSRRHLDEVIRREHAELDRRRTAYRGDAPPVPLEGRDAVVVDDGLATGYTARAAVDSARRRGAGRVILAVPVGAADTAAEMRGLVDDLVCVEAPTMLLGVGASYRDFRQTTDDEVLAALAAALPAPEEVEIPAGGVVLPGTLAVPAGAKGVVLFAHGSGSSRLSPRNRAVAASLQRAGLGTLLFDLLTPAEAGDRARVFDIPLLGARLGAAHDHLPPRAARLPACYFGSSTGAAAALTAAAGRDDVAAIVSRGGRPDLAEPSFDAVAAPVLLIVGGEDGAVVGLNEDARRGLGERAELAVVPGAGHLFEEPGALARVCELAAAWFLRWLG
ncbi:MAG: phosphoribosyltransferase [Actinobacteria bacterium]|nr:phosphoribosyltransferase [Actinomycetota bacterium]